MPKPGGEISIIAERMGLSFQKTWKWFWDTKQKIQKHTVLVKKIEKGERLTCQEFKTATFINKDAKRKQFNVETLADNLTLNTDRLA